MKRQILTKVKVFIHIFTQFTHNLIGISTFSHSFAVKPSVKLSDFYYDVNSKVSKQKQRSTESDNMTGFPSIQFN